MFSQRSRVSHHVANNVCPRLKIGETGKRAFDISAELLEDLLGLGFTYTRIAQMFGCNSNNLAETVLDLFLGAVKRDGKRWPSRIRVDRGVENVLVFVTCTTILFYAMESSGILNVEDPIQLFALHTIFIPRVNNSLREFSEAFNNHRVSTEGNWTPYQIWMNGMMHANNPLAHGDVDGEPDDIQLYGYDPEGPSPSEEYNNVVVEAMSLDNRHSIESYVLDVVDP
ncbi:unnamed protein product, partial [Porites evermanni]